MLAHNIEHFSLMKTYILHQLTVNFQARVLLLGWLVEFFQGLNILWDQSNHLDDPNYTNPYNVYFIKTDATSMGRCIKIIVGGDCASQFLLMIR